MGSGVFPPAKTTRSSKGSVWLTFGPVFCPSLGRLFEARLEAALLNGSSGSEVGPRAFLQEKAR